MFKAVQGESAKAKTKECGELLCSLSAEMETNENRVSKIRADYKKLIRWSEIFDSSDTPTKKMIIGYIIDRVYVYSNYRLHIEFNISIEHFLGGFEIPADIKVAKGT